MPRPLMWGICDVQCEPAMIASEFNNLHTMNTLLNNDFDEFSSNKIARWCHQMETFSALLAICAGNSPGPGEFPAQRSVTRNFDVSLICAGINGWVNSGDAGDLRRHRVHYDPIVMGSAIMFKTWRQMRQVQRIIVVEIVSVITDYSCHLFITA